MDRYTNFKQEGVGSIVAALVSPSKYTDLYFNKCHNKIVKISSLTESNVKNSQNH